MQFAAMALIGGVLYDMIRPAAKRRKYWIGIFLTAAFFLAMELFHLPVILCLLVYLALYMIAPFWTPAKESERSASVGDELPKPTHP